MLSALLRVVEAEGEIRLDGVPITRLGLATLRRALAVMPQDPVLFSGAPPRRFTLPALAAAALPLRPPRRATHRLGRHGAREPGPGGARPEQAAGRGAPDRRAGRRPRRPGGGPRAELVPRAKLRSLASRLPFVFALLLA